MLPYLIGGAAGAAAALGAGVYHSMNGQSQLFGATFIGTPGRGKQLALTYDDGPNDPDTLKLLDVLAKHNVKATFFLIGIYVQQRRDIAQRIIAEGHEIGNHTFTHPALSLCDRANVAKELAVCEGAILLAHRHASGQCIDSIQPQQNAPLPDEPGLIQQGAAVRTLSGTKYFRPPFGARRPATLRIAREMGYTPVMWSVWCYDWMATTADRVEAHAVKRIRGGDVILLHDGGHKRFGTDRSHTVEATDRIIRRYKDQGFEFVTVGKMIEKPDNRITE